MTQPLHTGDSVQADAPLHPLTNEANDNALLNSFVVYQPWP